VLRVFVETELSLGEPNVDEGLVTWFDVRVTAGEGADSAVIGNARVARIHVGEASNLGEPLYMCWTRTVASSRRVPASPGAFHVVLAGIT
jgi:hypothetical protein